MPYLATVDRPCNSTTLATGHHRLTNSDGKIVFLEKKNWWKQVATLVVAGVFFFFKRKFTIVAAAGDSR